MREHEYVAETASAGSTGSGNVAVSVAVPNKKKKTPLIKRENLDNSQEKDIKKIAEGVLDTHDDDGFMAKSELYKAAKYAAELHQMISDTDDLEPWVASKITKAADYLSSVKHYMEYNSISEPTMSDSNVDIQAA